MFNWIKGNPLFAGVIGIVLIIAALAGIRACTSQIDKSNANLVNQGVITERSRANDETINTVLNAQNAVDHPTSNQLNSVCEEYDRNC